MEQGGTGVGMSFTPTTAARHVEVALRIMQYFRPTEETSLKEDAPDLVDYLDDLMAKLAEVEGTVELPALEEGEEGKIIEGEASESPEAVEEASVGSPGDHG